MNTVQAFYTIYTLYMTERRSLHPVEPHSRLVQKVTDAISTIHGKEAHTRAYPIDQLLQDESGSCSSGETHVVATYKLILV